MNTHIKYYIPDFIPKISPVKQGKLIQSKLSQKMKVNLDREILTRHAEYLNLKEIKKSERDYIKRFQTHIKLRNPPLSNANSVKLPLISKEKSESPYIKGLLEIEYFKLEGKKINSKKKNPYFRFNTRKYTPDFFPRLEIV